MCQETEWKDKQLLPYDPKFSDRQVWANSADPDQTADERLDCLPFRLHLLNTLFYGKAAMSKF